jgi:hypothetical protein
MEYLKQLWDNSAAFRIVVCIMAAACALAIATADPSGISSPSAQIQSSAGSMADQLKQRLPSTPGGVIGEAQKTAETTLGVVNKSISTAEKGVDLAGNVIDEISRKLPSGGQQP